MAPTAASSGRECAGRLSELSLPARLSARLSACLSVRPSVWLPACLPERTNGRTDGAGQRTKVRSVNSAIGERAAENEEPLYLLTQHPSMQIVRRRCGCVPAQRAASVALVAAVVVDVALANGRTCLYSERR